VRYTAYIPPEGLNVSGLLSAMSAHRAGAVPVVGGAGGTGSVSPGEGEGSGDGERADGAGEPAPNGHWMVQKVVLEHDDVDALQQRSSDMIGFVFEAVPDRPDHSQSLQGLQNRDADTVFDVLQGRAMDKADVNVVRPQSTERLTKLSNHTGGLILSTVTDFVVLA
jgi:hypothetical protein